MTSCISLSHIVFKSPGGDCLLDDISCSISNRLTALVGPNGVGKSLLAQIAVGLLKPYSGQINRTGDAVYVAQQWPGSQNDSVAQVLGLDKPIKAIERISNGCGNEKDYELAEPWWNWQSDLLQMGREIGWNQKLDLNRSIGSYSGGEQVKLLWLAALLNNPDILIMDEPSNHLDTAGRKQLIDWLKMTNKQVLVISHDRDLLMSVGHILELSKQGIFEHSGNYKQYELNRSQRVSHARSRVESARIELKTQRKASQAAFEKQQQRVARGKLTANKKSLSPVEVGLAKNCATASLQRNKKLQQNRQDMQQRVLADAVESLEWEEPVVFNLPNSKVAANQQVCGINQLQNGFLKPLHPPIDLLISGPSIVQLVGKNGAGKSLFLSALAGLIKPLRGEVNVNLPFSLLDQHCRYLDLQQTGVENFSRLSPGADSNFYRQKLAWMRLRGAKAEQKVGKLSGGERFKVALACALLGPQTPQLLLLDEPTNHMDLESISALEASLSNFKGAIIFASHDKHFVKRLSPTHQLKLEDGVMKIISS